MLEEWAWDADVLRSFATNAEGEPIPAELVAKIENAATFNQGFATTEYLASALVDLAFHTADPAGLDPDAFERETLARLDMPDEIVMRHRSPHFGHVFSGEGYSAGYYGYVWADVLTADAAEAFAQAPGGFYDQALARRLAQQGLTVRPLSAYCLQRQDLRGLVIGYGYAALEEIRRCGPLVAAAVRQAVPN